MTRNVKGRIDSHIHTAKILLFSFSNIMVAIGTSNNREIAGSIRTYMRFYYTSLWMTIQYMSLKEIAENVTPFMQCHVRALYR